ncbi:gliding motility-associated C-terminal domain-containing protein [Sphingobacterium sp. SGL-16]|uniref:DUF7507 domain-containing protein n=1 Tax=Sphingobacterium sp. SGL-16 TaxID=2710883 RepID=UPI0013EAB3EA|nr:gliding motility-associated C-terminal domain-containing protein [Sphingobacterium sp. SGL-16]NGM72292.1 T9SS type B sorting domain-containing protein [Sphingobacterium sp. SGL-16]
MRENLKVLLIIFFFFQFNVAFSDGSKDLYPTGVKGARAYMETEVYNGNILYHNFYNNGRHFAYVKKNEILAVSSSAQGIGNGTIRVYSPSGHLSSPSNNTVGRITARPGMNNREAELAGPRLGYDAYEIPVDEEGIWTIEFTSPGNSSTLPNNLANENWTQEANQNFIAAWDISVRNESDTDWLTGRVFANVLNLHLNGGGMTDPNYAYYGLNYVLTKDGYYYRVDGNGSIGLRFTYFVNNSGVLDQNNIPIYKSSPAGFNASIHNPNGNDVGNEFITHKIFYTLPNLDLPKISRSHFGETWLLNEIQIPQVKNINFEGSEKTSNNVNTKGVKINFETNYAGRYKITIKSNDQNISFQPFEAIVNATVGNNEYEWKGVDGENNFVPHGGYNIQVSVASVEGEVHFPYFDMEINPNGLKLERFDRETNTLSPAILYWDDSDIPLGNNFGEHSNPITNLAGILSSQNGHRWGTYTAFSGAPFNNNLFTGNNSFGNNMAMDTWSYAVQVDESIEKEIVVEVADLEVISIDADKDTIELNDRVNYTMRVRNNGPSDVIGSNFEFSLPEGFTIENINFIGGDCASIGLQTITKNIANIHIDIKNGCEAVFIIRAFANNVPDATYGIVPAEAGIVRPKGYTDPDATLDDNAALAPRSAREECSPQGCNNIKINSDVFLLEPLNERGQIALLKQARHIDQNNSGFQEEGEIIEYKFTIRNTGEVVVKDFILIDTLVSMDTIVINGIMLAKNQQHEFILPYTITRQDVINGEVMNQALVMGKNPRNFDVKDLSGTDFNNNQKTRLDIDQRPLFQLKKTVKNAGQGSGENGQFTIGDEIIYQFEIKHEGNISIHNIKLIDELLFQSPQDLSINKIDNQITTVEYTYRVTVDDIRRGFVENTAIVEGYDTKYNNALRDTSGTTFENNDVTKTLVAKPPIAKADKIDVYQGANVELNVLANDERGSSDWNNGRVEIIDPPIMGRLEVNGINILYTQYNNLESGEDFFTYRIHDNSRLTSEIVGVDLTIIKTVPITVDDYFVQYYNTRVTISPADNDYVENSELDFESITIINQPMNGRLVYMGKGKFTYTSEKTFSGIDQFTYRIMDKNGNWSEPATVKIEVAGILIPNVITPNGDGLNDTVELIGVYQFERVEIQIFDRFKNLIYENSNYKNDWQVSSSVRDGTYFYILKFNKKGEKAIIRKGSLLITREKIN